MKFLSAAVLFAAAALTSAAPALPASDEATESLIAAARDANGAPAGRLEAVRRLRVPAAAEEGAARTLIDLASDAQESVPVRQRAARSLGYALALPGASYQSALAALKSLAAGDGARNTPTSVRVWAVRALYWAPVNDRDSADLLRAWLSRNAGEPPVVREAAAWALATVGARGDVGADLRAVFAEGDAPWSLREQALRSLYPGAADPENWVLALSLAQDPSGAFPLSVRKTAVLFLSPARGVPEVRAALEQAAGGFFPVLREAAVAALRPQTDLLRRHFQLRHDAIRHRMVEVLEMED